MSAKFHASTVGDVQACNLGALRTYVVVRATVTALVGAGAGVGRPFAEAAAIGVAEGTQIAES
ncbi:MAG: hypothetical protein ACRDUX_03270, partial [Mycobacterium sp.]